MEKMIQMQYNTEDKHSNMSSCSNKVGIEMVEVEVNPKKVTVSDSPLYEKVVQLFSVEWLMAQEAAGTPQQDNKK